MEDISNPSSNQQPLNVSLVKYLHPVTIPLPVPTPKSTQTTS